LFGAYGSVNWNWPGETFVATPNAIQALGGSARFVVATTESFLLSLQLPLLVDGAEALRAGTDSWDKMFLPFWMLKIASQAFQSWSLGPAPSLP